MPANRPPRIDRSGGFEIVGADGGELWVRPGDRDWAAAALENAGSLYRSARESPGARPIGGRGPALMVLTAEGPRVVRPYLRGGWMAPLLGDRYLRVAASRPRREIVISSALRARGIPTPEITAAAVYPCGAFHRAELVTRYVPNSRTLAAAMENGAPRDLQEADLTAVGSLIGQLGKAGLRHPDFHAENILTQSVGGRSRAWVLDLDRCRIVRTRNPTTEARILRARLLKSLAKRRRAMGRRLEAWIGVALDRGVSQGS